MKVGFKISLSRTIMKIIDPMPTTENMVMSIYNNILIISIKRTNVVLRIYERSLYVIRRVCGQTSGRVMVRTEVGQ